MDKINHYNDALFKDNLHYCKQLLRTLLISVCNAECSKHHFQIRDINFLDPETQASNVSKKSVNDALIKIDTVEGEEIVCDIELQTYPEGKKSLCVRVRHYAYNLFSRNKLKKGQSYKGTTIPNLLQIWFIKNEAEIFSRYPEKYHFCIQGIDSRSGEFLPGLSQDEHFININYFEAKAKKCNYKPKSDLEHIMMFFTCKSKAETERYVKFHYKPYLDELLENEKSFFDDEDNLELYMKFEQMERRAEEAEAEAKEAQAKAVKAEAEKAEAQARADKAEADNAKLRAFLAKNGIDISTISD